MIHNLMSLIYANYVFSFVLDGTSIFVRMCPLLSPIAKPFAIL